MRLLLHKFTHDLDCSYQSPAHCSDDEKQEACPASANAFRKLKKKIFDKKKSNLEMRNMCIDLITNA